MFHYHENMNVTGQNKIQRSWMFVRCWHLTFRQLNSSHIQKALGWYLNFCMRCQPTVIMMTTNRVQQHNSNRPSHDKQLSDHTRSFTDELLYELRAGDTDERALGVMGNSTGQQRLTSARRTIQQHSLNAQTHNSARVGILPWQKVQWKKPVKTGKKYSA